jgi:N-acetylglucosamine-6-phosphate deacetylase
LTIRGGRIERISPDNPYDESSDVIRYEGGYILPGFVDVQVNGGGGILFNDETTVDALRTMAIAHARHGTTALLPTLISEDIQKISDAIDVVDAAVSVGIPGIIGIHIEGPFLNSKRKGIHDASKFRALDDAAFEILTKPGRGVRVVTVAPEIVGCEVISRLSRAGVRVSIGHTDATFSQAHQALRAGATAFTHLFNAMSPLQSREPGVVGAALIDQGSYIGIIADGAHVHPACIELAINLRGADHVMLVSDAMAGVGCDLEEFNLFGQKISIKDNICRSEDGTLAGSNLNMEDAFSNIAEWHSLDLATISKMASYTPAKFLGIDSSYGAVMPGYRADLVHRSAGGKVTDTWIEGALVR